MILALYWMVLLWSRPQWSFAGKLPKVSISPVAWQEFNRLSRKNGCTAQNAVGVFYATQTGNTETVASKIGEATGLEASDYDGEDFADLDGVIAGCPTWNTGADEYRSGTTWDDYLETIKEYDLSGKVVAVFGCGDSQSYGDNFCDGIEELHNAFQAAGAKMVGYVDASGYTFEESKSVKNGKFMGLPLDEDNEGDMTDGRISAWLEQLKSEGMPFWSFTYQVSCCRQTCYCQWSAKRKIPWQNRAISNYSRLIGCVWRRRFQNANFNFWYKAAHENCFVWICTLTAYTSTCIDLSYDL